MPPSSRWADTEEDAALAQQAKLEKEEKRRKRAEKVRKAEEAAAAQQAEEAARPSKRRKTTPTPDEADDGIPAKLLRFEARTFGPSASIEGYDKLNDIEEGTYGYVARATQKRTGKVVALKKLKFEKGDRNGLPVTGLREIQILRNCSHKNVVSLEEVVAGNETTSLTKYVSYLYTAQCHRLKLTTAGSAPYIWYSNSSSTISSPF